MWELDHKESWAPKNWYLWTVVLEKTLESPLDCKEIQPVHPTGDQSWVFIGRTDVEAETPILWPPDVKSWLTGKDPDAGKDWGQEEKGMTEDEMVGWHHQLNGHGFGWTLGVGDGQRGLVCCGSWGRKESDTTERRIELNWRIPQCSKDPTGPWYWLWGGQATWELSLVLYWNIPCTRAAQRLAFDVWQTQLWMSALPYKCCDVKAVTEPFKPWFLYLWIGNQNYIYCRELFWSLIIQ